jgi:glucose-6-phosphate 1-dehydrogenase
MMPTSVEPLLFVIFGATGDLARRKLLPALHRLVQQGYLEESIVLGTARATDIDTNTFRQVMSDVVPSEWRNKCLYYCGIGDGTDDDFRRLTLYIEGLEGRHNLTGNRIFYLGVPPEAFATPHRRTRTTWPQPRPRLDPDRRRKTIW